MLNQVRKNCYKQSGGKRITMEKQLPPLKQGEELEIFKNGKKSRYMDSLQDRVKNKEVRQHGLGLKRKKAQEMDRSSHIC